MHVRSHQINSALVAIEAVSVLHIFKRPFLFGMVDAAKVAKLSLLLYILYKIPLDAYNRSLFLAIMSGIDLFVLFVVGGIDAVLVAAGLVGARRGHFGDILFFVLDCPSYLALESVLVAEVSLHLSDGRS